MEDFSETFLQPVNDEITVPAGTAPRLRQRRGHRVVAAVT